MMDWNGHMSSGGWILSILVIIVIGAAIVWIARELSARPDRGGAAVMSPREILDRRLASGEINTEQYDELRQTLRGTA
jgi:putative membrane protein